MTDTVFLPTNPSNIKNPKQTKSHKQTNNKQRLKSALSPSQTNKTNSSHQKQKKLLPICGKAETGTSPLYIEKGYMLIGLVKESYRPSGAFCWCFTGHISKSRANRSCKAPSVTLCHCSREKLIKGILPICWRSE